MNCLLSKIAIASLLVSGNLINAQNKMENVLNKRQQNLVTIAALRLKGISKD